MTDHDAKMDDTYTLYKRLRWYFERFMDRKCALQDNGVLSDFTARDHTVNEWLYDMDNRLRRLEGLLAESTGAEHEQSIEIPTYVNHLIKE